MHEKSGGAPGGISGCGENIEGQIAGTVRKAAFAAFPILFLAESVAAAAAHQQ